MSVQPQEIAMQYRNRGWSMISPTLSCYKGLMGLNSRNTGISMKPISIQTSDCGFGALPALP